MKVERLPVSNLSEYNPTLREVFFIFAPTDLIGFRGTFAVSFFSRSDLCRRIYIFSGCVGRVLLTAGRNKIGEWVDAFAYFIVANDMFFN